MTRWVLAAAAAAALTVPSTATAAVAIDADRVTVSTEGASVTATRAPFRLAFADGAGRTVLRQVENTGQAPLPIAPTPDPIPLGADTVRRPTLYAPFAFTVGSARDVQYPSTQYAGNNLAGTEAGTMFSARDVLDAKPAGDGAELTVATSDPTRRLVVTLRPGTGASIRVAVRVTPDAGVATIHDAFAATSTEAFRGFGGRHNALDQRGQDFYSWNEQQNTSAGSLEPAVSQVPGTQGDRYQFPNGPTAAYYNQALFYSPERFGFLVDRDELLRFRMASDRPDAWQVGVQAPALEYVVAPGDAPQAIRTITAINGRHRVPPRWALDATMDRLVRFPPEGAAAYKASVEDDLRRLERRQVRLSAYRIEGWYLYAPDELRAVIGRLQGVGTRALLYFRAFVESEANGYDDNAAFVEAVEKGYVARTPAGTPFLYLTNYNVPGALIDFTNPDARAWWERRVRRGLDLGADGFMQDFGEQVQMDMRFADGSTGAEMHNRYPKLYHRWTRDVVERYRRETGREIFFYTRTGYSGSPGSAADENGNFAGDSTTDWSRSTGLGSLATDMLNRGVGGAFGFLTDIGGYFDVGPYSPTTKELFLRWTAWAALSPHFRVHGSVGAGTHAPWTFDDETVAIYNRFAELHRRAIPLIERLWREGVRTGLPPARPLWLQAPGDPEAARQDQQWMLGPDVLVAPVVTQGAQGRDVYFPAGCWEHPETGARFAGGRSARVAAATDELPYFFRCGTQPFRAAAAGGATLPAARTCRSRRNFRIRLRRDLVSARVFVNGRRVRTLRPARRGGRLRARVDLRGLPRGRFTVRIVGRTRKGRTVVSRRAYRTCVPR